MDDAAPPIAGSRAHAAFIDGEVLAKFSSDQKQPAAKIRLPHGRVHALLQ